MSFMAAAAMGTRLNGDGCVFTPIKMWVQQITKGDRVVQEGYLAGTVIVNTSAINCYTNRIVAGVQDHVTATAVRKY